MNRGDLTNTVVNKNAPYAFGVTVERHIPHSVDKVWECLSTLEGIRGWKSPKGDAGWAEGEGIVLDFKVRGKILDTYKVGEKLFTENWEFLDIQPKKSFLIHWHDYKDSRVEFKIVPLDDAVVLRITHRNIRSKDESAQLTSGWEWTLSNVQAFLEIGRGLTWEEWDARNSGT